VCIRAHATHTTELDNTMNTFRTATISGTRKGMSKEQQARMCDILDELPSLSYVRHGDCVGVDEKAHEIVRSRFSRLTIHIHPPLNDKDRAFCDGDVTYDAEAFLKRDRTMVNDSDVLLAFTDSRKERLRSGTWTTIRHARRLGSPLVIVFPGGEVKRENFDFVDDEESLETYGYDPDCHSSHANVQDCIEENGELRYADIAPEEHTIVINQHVLVGFKMFRKYHESGTRHETLIITHAAVVKRLRRSGMFTSVVDELVRLLEPQFVVIEAVLPGGGMPEWCSKNGFSDKYATGSFTKCMGEAEHPTGL